jgi:hypothetical protein
MLNKKQRPLLGNIFTDSKDKFLNRKTARNFCTINNIGVRAAMSKLNLI